MELAQLYGISSLCLVLERVRIVYIYVLLSEQRGVHKVAVPSSKLIGYRAARLYHIVLVLMLTCIVVRQPGLLCRCAALYCSPLRPGRCLRLLVLCIWCVRYTASDVLGVSYYELCIGRYSVYARQAVIRKELVNQSLIIQEVIAEYLR